MPELQKRSWWLTGTGSGAPWSAHRYCVSGSSELNRNIAVVLSVDASGAPVIVTTGGVMSPLVQVWTSRVWSTLPAGLFARTMNSCSPCGMFVYVRGELQGVNVGVSSAHSNVADALGELNVNVCDVASVSSGGRPTRDSAVSGASSIVHVNVAGVPSGWSAGSSARTRSVWEP